MQEGCKEKTIFFVICVRVRVCLHGLIDRNVANNTRLGFIEPRLLKSFDKFWPMRFWAICKKIKKSTSKFTKYCSHDIVFVSARTFVGAACSTRIACQRAWRAQAA